MDDAYKDTPLAASSVTLQLEQIQRRCSQLLDEPDGLELSLEEPAPAVDDGNPYNRG